MIKQVVFYNGDKPELARAALLANLAGCAYQDKDLREEYEDIKNSAFLQKQESGQKPNDFMFTNHLYSNINRSNSQEEDLL